MDDKRLLEHAKGYIDQMADGINPLTGEDEPADSCLQQTRISRCLRYVSGILGQVLNGELAAPSAAPKKIPFALTQEQLETVKPADKPVSLSRFLEHLYQFGGTENMKKIPFKRAQQWLEQNGMLAQEDGKFRPTSGGQSIGIVWKDDAFYPGIYYAVSAQQWIIDRLPELLAFTAQKPAEKMAVDPETGEILPDGKLPFSLTAGQLDEVPIIPGGVSISRLVSSLNTLIDTSRMAKLKREQVTGWLTEEGYLYVYDGGARPSLRPTPKGEQAGIKWEHRNGPSGPYWGTFYYDDAQLLILEHLGEGQDGAE